MKFFSHLFFFFSFILLTNVCFADPAYGPPANVKVCFEPNQITGDTWPDQLVKKSQLGKDASFCITQLSAEILNFAPIPDLTPFETDVIYAAKKWLALVRPVASLKKTPTLQIVMRPLKNATGICGAQSVRVSSKGKIDGYQYLEPTALRLFNTGENPSNINIIIYCDTSSSTLSTIFFDPDPQLRKSASAMIIKNKFDITGTLLHEIAHGLGIDSNRDPLTGKLKGLPTRFDTLTMQIPEFYPYDPKTPQKKLTLFWNPFSLSNSTQQVFFVSPITQLFLKEHPQTEINSLPGIPLMSLVPNPYSPIPVGPTNFSHLGILISKSSIPNNISIKSNCTSSFYRKNAANDVFVNDLMSGCGGIDMGEALSYGLLNGRFFIKTLDLKIMEAMGYATVPTYFITLPLKQLTTGFKLLSVVIAPISTTQDELRIKYQDEKEPLYVVIKTDAYQITPADTSLWSLSDATYTLNLPQNPKQLPAIQVNLLGSLPQEEEDWLAFVYKNNKTICIEKPSDALNGPVFLAKNFNKPPSY